MDNGAKSVMSLFCFSKEELTSQEICRRFISLNCRDRTEISGRHRKIEENHLHPQYQLSSFASNEIQQKYKRTADSLARIDWTMDYNRYAGSQIKYQVQVSSIFLLPFVLIPDFKRILEKAVSCDTDSC